LKDELLLLRRKAEILSAELEETRKRLETTESDGFEQGDDVTEIAVDIFESTSKVIRPWGEIFRAILPLTFGVGANVDLIAGVLSDMVREGASGPIPVSVHLSSISKILNQMVALGLIEGQGDPGDSATRWVATKYGTHAGCRMLAVKRFSF